MPDLKANDKYPNIDGYLELADSEGFPRGTIKVQIKKLSKESVRKKQYAFRNEKFLSYCANSQDWTPILFIGVDIENEKAYWLHIDKAYEGEEDLKKLVMKSKKLNPKQISNKADDKAIFLR